MSVWGKILTSLRGKATEAGQAYVDKNAISILEQEIRDAEAELRSSKTQLAAIMGKFSLAQKKCNELKATIEQYENHAMSAMEKNEMDLANQVAEKIGEYQSQLDSEETMRSGLETSVANLKAAVKKAEANLRTMKQQVDTVKATESVQKAQAACAARYSGTNSRLSTATESLERIKRKQEERAAQMSAADELNAETSGSDLDAKLREAGIGGTAGSANDILERIKAKKAAAEAS
ncbi:PspA/IM30 family protein [Parendozoicomonas haliclonae]|uniref:PspA/IM30 family protein n=1 Tax=Parendozoicomonas haliclonae TaxID=1960125 RepID=A0A1X7AR13_9GAMM|nr:PspA/IM30 family protein [Parendozoicomonas haliclonae]SMA50754.1 PspA/IM30 family protein [Parendozoicomonas haliclonae]